MVSMVIPALLNPLFIFIVLLKKKYLFRIFILHSRKDHRKLLAIALLW